MTKQEFKDLVGKKLLFLDGATGSNLQKKRDAKRRLPGKMDFGK